MSPKLFNTLLILVSVVLYFMVIKPLYTGDSSIFFEPKSGIQKLTHSNDEYSVALDQFDQITRDSKKLGESYTLLDENIKHNAFVMVPQSIDEVKLLSEMNSIASAQGISLEGLAAKDKGAGRYSINFTVKTTYQKFKDFIAKYEKSMRLITLDSVNFNAGTNDDDIIKFSVVLSTYYLK